MKKNFNKDIDLSSFLKVISNQKGKIKALFWKIGENAFLSILLLFFISFLLGGIVFYKYSFSVQEKEYETIETPLQFRKEDYEKILNTWEKKEEEIKESKEKDYQNPFLGKEVKKEEELEENSEVITYTIEKEDNLWNIALEYLGTGFRWKEIINQEGESFPDWRAEVLEIGEKVLIPSD